SRSSSRNGWANASGARMASSARCPTTCAERRARLPEVAGCSWQSIADVLNADAVPSVRGGDTLASLICTDRGRQATGKTFRTIANDHSSADAASQAPSADDAETVDPDQTNERHESQS